MNDRFKFRVYHLFTGKYVDDGEVEILLQNTGLLLFGNWHNDIRVAQSEYGIEQCTGLSDKNGKLIYEGDIIFDGYCKRIVKWGGWCWHAESKSAICPLDNFTLKESEIIGNIHEQTE